MEIIKLPQSEIAEMKQFYQDEYERLTRRLQHIKTIMEHIGIEEPEPEISARKTKARAAGSETSKTPQAAKRKKRTGRKSKWELLIMKRLRQLDKPVTYDELTDEILSFAKIPPSKRTSTKQAIVNVIFRLRNRDKKLDTFSIGSREKYIALKGWFEKPGEIRKEYASKIAAAPKNSKPKSAKRGRPRKVVQTS